MAGLSAGASDDATTRRAPRCSECHRVLPGRMDRISRRPVYLAVAGSLVYPGLRLIWVFGGTLGTTGDETDVPAPLAWALIGAGSTLVAFTLVLLIDRGPLWLRALLGFGGLFVGAGLVTVGGAGVVMSVSFLITEGAETSPGAGLTIWTFLAVYGSWFVAGIGVVAGSWRYWAHRRDGCSGCAPLLM